jgi:hypothetical protein
MRTTHFVIDYIEASSASPLCCRKARPSPRFSLERKSIVTTTSIGSSNAIFTDEELNSDYMRNLVQMCPKYGRLLPHFNHRRHAEFICRATLAYLRQSWNGKTSIPSENYSYLWRNPDTDSHEYVVLAGEEGKLLAVYRIDTRDKLKRLWRAPYEIESRHGKIHRSAAARRGNLTRARARASATMKEAA